MIPQYLVEQVDKTTLEMLIECYEDVRLALWDMSVDPSHYHPEDVEWFQSVELHIRRKLESRGCRLLDTTGPKPYISIGHMNPINQ